MAHVPLNALEDTVMKPPRSGCLFVAEAAAENVAIVHPRGNMIGVDNGQCAIHKLTAAALKKFYMHKCTCVKTICNLATGLNLCRQNTSVSTIHCSAARRRAQAR
jgi:hypothetical protein